MQTVSVHRFYEGKVYHKRFSPKEHAFVYNFFMLDIDVKSIDTLHNGLFSYETFNLFSFTHKDHFGKSNNFVTNVHALAQEFNVPHYDSVRFLTLPRIAGFVFNPFAAAVFIDKGKPLYMLAEVHNYNGGRIVYPIALHAQDNGTLIGSVAKDMYVSPFFDRDGVYDFIIDYSPKKLGITIKYSKDNKQLLTAALVGHVKTFSAKNIAKLFVRHTFLTLWVVTRTLWQSLRLKLKGITWGNPPASDTIKRY